MLSEVYQYHKGRYGFRRITVWLKRQGLRINHKVVQKLMEQLDLYNREIIAYSMSERP
ncbi:transposase, partial [Salmonella enterica]|nr:transposase [Salmonella enterica]